MLNRREALKIVAATGVGTAVFHRAVVGIADGEVTLDKLKSAAWIAELELSEEEYEKILNALNSQVNQIARLREIKLDVKTPPAFQFNSLAPIESSPKIVRNLLPLIEQSRLPDSGRGNRVLTCFKASGTATKSKADKHKIDKNLPRPTETLRANVTLRRKLDRETCVATGC